VLLVPGFMQAGAHACAAIAAQCVRVSVSVGVCVCVWHARAAREAPPCASARGGACDSMCTGPSQSLQLSSIASLPHLSKIHFLCEQGKEVVGVAGGAEHTIAILSTGEVSAAIWGGVEWTAEGLAAGPKEFAYDHFGLCQDEECSRSPRRQ